LSVVAEPAISVVLPVYRTSAMILELHRRLVSTLGRMGLPFELIFVDDACPEGSAEILRSLEVADGRVRALYNAVNLGQRESVIRGLRVSTGGVVVIMDSDLQDEPEQIPLLVESLRAGGVEAVFAGRLGPYQAAYRMIESRVFKRIIHWVAGVPADAGSFVAMSRRMVSAVLALSARRPYMLALIGATGLPVQSIPVPRATRPEGRSAYSEWSRLRFALSGLRAAIELKKSK